MRWLRFSAEEAFLFALQRIFQLVAILR